MDSTDLFWKPKERLPFAEYVAVALIDVARSMGDAGITCPIQYLSEYLFNRFGFEISPEEVSDAVEILADCDLAFLAKDPLAGTFISISDERFSALHSAVGRDKDRYHQAIARAGDDQQAQFYAEEQTPTPSWDLLRAHKVIERYSEFGTPFIESAMKRLGEADFTSRLSRGSDRLVSFSDNLSTVEEIRSGLASIRKDLEFNNEVVTVIGESKDEAISEIDNLSGVMSGSSSRVGYLLDLSRKVLGWIGKLVANTSLAEVVKHVTKLFLEWLS